MNWYFTVRGGHTHVRVFMNGGKCGDLCFRNEEFEQIRWKSVGINFIADDGYNDFITISPRQFTKGQKHDSR